MTWQSLFVRDCRHVKNPVELFEEVVEHLMVAETMSGEGVVTIFRPVFYYYYYYISFLAFILLIIKINNKTKIEIFRRILGTSDLELKNYSICELSTFPFLSTPLYNLILFSHIPLLLIEMTEEKIKWGSYKNAALTQRCILQGWEPPEPRTPFDILPVYYFFIFY